MPGDVREYTGTNPADLQGRSALKHTEEDLVSKKKQIDTALKFWRLTHWAKRLGNTPPFKQMAGLIVSEKVMKASFIPVAEDIDVPPGVVMPRELFVDYVTRASHRVIIHECPCRAGEGCENYPIDLGCIIIGDGSRDINAEVGREATVEEAIAHIDRGFEMGLLPLVGHLKIDTYVFGIKDYSKFLTLCLCCECCCIARSEMRNLVTAYPNSLVRLDGVRVEVTDECVGCGECVPECPVENIHISDDIAVMGNVCVGCGRCVETCTRGFVKMTIDRDAPFQEDLRRRVEAGVNIE